MRAIIAAIVSTFLGGLFLDWLCSYVQQIIHSNIQVDYIQYCGVSFMLWAVINIYAMAWSFYQDDD